jgi:hypothetical protein
MAQQKSEDRVGPEGGVMPVERAGSSPGGQGKAVPVEETAVQLCLPIVTAESPKGATRRRSRDWLGEIRAGAPKAIDTTGTASSVTMEGVVRRLTSALLKVASNKGAPGPDGQTIERLLEQWPIVLPRLSADLLAGRYRPGGIRRVFIPKAGGGRREAGSAGWGFRRSRHTARSRNELWVRCNTPRSRHLTFLVRWPSRQAMGQARQRIPGDHGALAAQGPGRNHRAGPQPVPRRLGGLLPIRETPPSPSTRSSSTP